MRTIALCQKLNKIFWFDLEHLPVLKGLSSVDLEQNLGTIHESIPEHILLFKASLGEDPPVQSRTTPCFKAPRGNDPWVKHLPCVDNLRAQCKQLLVYMLHAGTMSHITPTRKRFTISIQNKFLFLGLQAETIHELGPQIGTTSQVHE